MFVKPLLFTFIFSLLLYSTFLFPAFWVYFDIAEGYYGIFEGIKSEEEIDELIDSRFLDPITISLLGQLQIILQFTLAFITIKIFRIQMHFKLDISLRECYLVLITFFLAFALSILHEKFFKPPPNIIDSIVHQ